MALPLSDTKASSNQTAGGPDTIARADVVQIDNATTWTGQIAEPDSEPLVPVISGASVWLDTMIRHLGSGVNLVSVPVRLVRGGRERLSGRFAFRRITGRWGLPLAIFATWTNGFFFSGTPWIAREGAEDTISAMLEAAGGAGARAVLLHNVPGDGRFLEALERSNARWAITSNHVRAGLDCTTTFETWFASNFTRKRRKELKRLRARLSEAGDLKTAKLASDDDPGAWTDQFLQLEAAGWKGECGTAIACDDAMQGFVRDVLQKLHAEGRLHFWRLSVDDKPVAMLFAMQSGRNVWLGKIAYDEALARFSPGVLLILDATQSLLCDPGVDFADSSAVPDHPMINRVWRDRIAIADILIATAGTSATAFELMQRAETVRNSLRRTAKSLYLTYLKGGSR